MEANRIYNENCLTGLKNLSDNSIDCCITSPPYFGLRDYGHAEQLGLEETPELYIQKMVEVFSEVKRVLKKEGTLWLNIGDSYASVSGGGRSDVERMYDDNENKASLKQKPSLKHNISLKPKDLIGIPWMLAFALRADGWYLRQDIIWAKPNPMPESVTDRCTKSHEYIFLLSKSAKYYYDAEAIKSELKGEPYHMIPKGWAVGEGSHKSIDHATIEGQKRKHKNLQSKGQQAHSIHKARLGLLGSGLENHSGNYDKDGNVIGNGKANKRSVWTITTQPYSDAHFATFPEDLIVDMIKAGCPENGIVLDPFMGAGTTALVSSKLNRNYIGFEINEEYIKIAENRLQKHLGMFHPSNLPA